MARTWINEPLQPGQEEVLYAQNAGDDECQLPRHADVTFKCDGEEIRKRIDPGPLVEPIGYVSKQEQ